MTAYLDITSRGTYNHPAVRKDMESEIRRQEDVMLSCCLQLLTWADVAISDFLTGSGRAEDRLRATLANPIQWFRNTHSLHELPECCLRFLEGFCFPPRIS